jgi:hypothetical protein
MLSSLIRRKRERSEMTFLEHIEDLRVSVIRVLTVFAVGMVAALIYFQQQPLQKCAKSILMFEVLKFRM